MSDTPDRPPQVGEILDRYLEQMGAPPASTLNALPEIWPTIVGPALAGTTRPVEIVDGVLVVACTDATWASQVRWMESSIRTAFDDRFPELRLRRVQTRIDR